MLLNKSRANYQFIYDEPRKSYEALKLYVTQIVNKSKLINCGKYK